MVNSEEKPEDGEGAAGVEPEDAADVKDAAADFAVKDLPAEIKEQWAGRLALGVIAVLALVIIGQYAIVAICVFNTENGKDCAEAFKQIYDPTLAVLSALTGSAVTYYFTSKK